MSIFPRTKGGRKDDGGHQELVPRQAGTTLSPVSDRDHRVVLTPIAQDPPVAASGKTITAQEIRSRISTSIVQDTPAAAPGKTVTAQEIRSRIVAARRMKSDTNLRTRHSSQQPRANARPSSLNEVSIPRRSPQPTQSSLSLNEVVMNQAHRPQARQSTPQVRNRQPNRLHDAYSTNAVGNCSDSADPRKLPMPLPNKPKTRHSMSSRTSLPRVKSPLSKVEEPPEADEFFSSSSQESACSAISQSTATSSSSHSTSATSTHSSIQPSKPAPLKFTSAKLRKNPARAPPLSSHSDTNNAKKTMSKVPSWRYEDFVDGRDTPTKPRPGQNGWLSLTSIFRRRVAVAS